MARECNSEAAGKAARLRGGIMAVIGGAVVGIGIITGIVAGPFWWLATAGAFAGGAFSIFEARAGWCVVRALGIRTPL
jgi:hypothetical protein